MWPKVSASLIKNNNIFLFIKEKIHASKNFSKIHPLKYISCTAVRSVIVDSLSIVARIVCGSLCLVLVLLCSL